MWSKNIIYALGISVLSLTSGCSGCGDGASGVSDTPTTVKDTAADLASIEEGVKSAASRSEKVSLLKKGFDVAKSGGQAEKAISFAAALVKENESPKEMLSYIAEKMNSGGSKPAAQLMIQGLVDNYGSDESIAGAKRLLESPILDKDAYIQKIAESVFENPDKYGINFANARKYVDVCEAHGLAYPNDARSPEYLYKASEIAVAIRTYPKALNLYDWLIDFYPDYEKTPNALFAKGYLLDEQLDKRERAKAAFSSFLVSYPDHELADDAKFLLENIGKSGDEIIKIIEQNRDKQAK